MGSRSPSTGRGGQCSPDRITTCAGGLAMPARRDLARRGPTTIRAFTVSLATQTAQLVRTGERRPAGPPSRSAACWERDPRTGMVLDLAKLREYINVVRATLDHHFLDDIADLGRPTIENLTVYVAHELRALEPRVAAVRVRRKASGDSCLFASRQSNVQPGGTDQQPSCRSTGLHRPAIHPVVNQISFGLSKCRYLKNYNYSNSM
jgi:6-pyruvoyl-tetrahydropterin synthase